MSSTTGDQDTAQRPKLQAVNYANIVGYVLNLGVTYGVGVSGYFPTNGELSAKYQSLVTPAGYAFAIWGVIFVSQFIWTILQALPAYRSSDLVIKGVGYWYVWICAAQCAWTLVFANELIEVSLGAMLAILLGLAIATQKLSFVPVDFTWKYWGFKFPFHIHCGWIWAASVVNTNVVLVARNVSASSQVIAAWISLGFLVMVSAIYLYRELYVIPLVAAWATYAVHVELSSPRDSIANTFDVSTIEMLQQTAFTLAIVVAASTVITGLYRFVRQRQTSPETPADTNYNNMES